MSIFFLYSGQGSQYHHMAAGLYESEPVFRERMEVMNQAAVKYWGQSVVDALYDPSRKKADTFDDTAFSSLGLFMVEYALTETLRHYGRHPDGLVGVSLGAFTAACVCGAADWREMVDALFRQSGLLERACPRGAMLAVLADPAVHEAWPDLRDCSEIASINGDNHFVLSLPMERLARVESRLTLSGIAFHRMPVALPYHSRWIEPARADALASLRRVSFRRHGLPVDLCASPGASVCAEGLWDCVRGRIRWLETIRKLERNGPHLYIDLGPSGTLATLAKHALPPGSRSQAHAILSPYGNEEANLHRVLAAA